MDFRAVLGRSAAARGRTVAALGDGRCDFRVPPYLPVLARLRAHGDTATAGCLADYWSIAVEHPRSAFRADGPAGGELDDWLARTGRHFAEKSLSKSYIGFVLAIESLQLCKDRDGPDDCAADLAASLAHLVEECSPEPGDAELIESVAFSVLGLLEAIALPLRSMPGSEAHLEADGSISRK